MHSKILLGGTVDNHGHRLNGAKPKVVGKALKFFEPRNLASVDPRALIPDMHGRSPHAILSRVSPGYLFVCFNSPQSAAVVRESEA